MIVDRAPAQPAAPATPTAARSRLDLYPYWLLLPSLLALGIVILYPIAQATLLSFQEGNLLKGGAAPDRPFVGLRNYITALSLPEFWRSLWVSLAYSIAAVIGSYVIGLAMALMLTATFRGRAVARVLAIAPWAMPPVVTSIVWLWMYDPQFGVINYILLRIGVIAGNLSWLSDPLLALPAVIIVTVWKHVPLAMMVLLAGLQSIPRELYEAARIDGAGPLGEFRYVTVPGLRPVSAVIVLMLSLWTFKEFTYVYVLTGGGPGRATETLVLQVYDQAFKYLDFGLAAATGVLVMLMCFAFAAVYLPVVYGRERDGRRI
ncbi:MAG: sugar ABC transporter permease [Chloroflexi bacterium]|nr:sugar ABC transporter permease [Chloroflexota bacterium]